MRGPLDTPVMAGFVAANDAVNALAERSPGFVWRHDDPNRRAVGLTEGAPDPLLLLNVSVWRDYPCLHAFVYRTAHGGAVRRRAEWFTPIDGPTTVLWWVPVGRRPTVHEAMTHLWHLRRFGPTPQAFGVRVRFDPSGVRESGRPSC
jgi:hypothetical protein